MKAGLDANVLHIITKNGIIMVMLNIRQGFTCMVMNALPETGAKVYIFQIQSSKADNISGICKGGYVGCTV